MGEHGGLVHCSYKVDILTIESLSEVYECSVEAVISVSNSIVDVRMQVLSSHEHVSRERGNIVSSLDMFISGAVTIDFV